MTDRRLPRPGESPREILERRARALARPLAPPAGARTGSPNAIAVFEIGGNRYGIEARHVREVGRLAGLASLPGVPAFFAGITVIRGEIVAIVDLLALLGLARRGVTDLSRIVVLGDEAMEIAILVDRALEVAELGDDAVLALPHSSGGDATLLRGVTRDGLVLLDGAALLADPRLTIDDSFDRNPT